MDKQWQLFQTKGHFWWQRIKCELVRGGKKVTHQSLQRGLTVPGIEGCVAVRLRCLCPCKILHRQRWNEISELELRSRDFTQLTERDTLAFQLACVGLCKREREGETSFLSCPLTPFVYRSRILVLFHSKCVSHGSHRRSSLSDPLSPLPSLPVVLFPLSSPFLGMF